MFRTSSTGVWRAAACGVAAMCCALAACGSPSGPSSTRIVTAITPSQGTTLGGTTVTISGLNFSAGATVTIGGSAAASAQVMDANTIKAVTGMHAAFTTDVTVVIGTDRATLPGAFTSLIPQPSTNQPPVITSIVAQGSRTNEPVQYTDVDSQGLPVQKQHQVQGTSLVDVHDSISEIGGMSRQFLLDFSDSTIRDASYVVRNFMMGCGEAGMGKQNEQNDVQENRNTFWIDSSSVSASPRVTVNFASTCPFRSRKADACSAIDVRWTSHCIEVNPVKGCNAIGQSGTVTGVDWVTAHYDPPSKRWWLCDSDFDETSGTLRIMR